MTTKTSRGYTLRRRSDGAWISATGFNTVTVGEPKVVAKLATIKRHRIYVLINFPEVCPIDIQEVEIAITTKKIIVEDPIIQTRLIGLRRLLVAKYKHAPRWNTPVSDYIERAGLLLEKGFHMRYFTVFPLENGWNSTDNIYEPPEHMNQLATFIKHTDDKYTSYLISTDTDLAKFKLSGNFTPAFIYDFKTETCL